VGAEPEKGLAGQVAPALVNVGIAYEGHGSVEKKKVKRYLENRIIRS